MKKSDGNVYDHWVRLAREELSKSRPDPGVCRSAMIALERHDPELTKALKESWVKNRYSRGADQRVLGV